MNWINGMAHQIYNWFPDKSKSTSILFTAFNQDCSCCSVGTKQGFRIYHCDPFSKSFVTEDGGCRFARMLFSSSLIALVGHSETPKNSPRYNTKSRQNIVTANFSDTVLDIKLNKQRLIAVLKTRINIFKLDTMKLLHALDSPSNTNGINDLS